MTASSFILIPTVQPWCTQLYLGHARTSDLTIPIKAYMKQMPHCKQRNVYSGYIPNSKHIHTQITLLVLIHVISGIGSRQGRMFPATLSFSVKVDHHTVLVPAARLHTRLCIQHPGEQFSAFGALVVLGLKLAVNCLRWKEDNVMEFESVTLHLFQFNL